MPPACVGRWYTLRPTLDAGVSSVLFICMLIFAVMLECCSLLSQILAPCMPSSVWPLWQLPFKFANHFPSCMLVYMYYFHISSCMFLLWCSMWHACLTYDAWPCLDYFPQLASMFEWFLKHSSCLQHVMHLLCVGRSRYTLRPMLDADILCVLHFCSSALA